MDAAKLLRKVTMSAGCWEWTGARKRPQGDAAGYGVIRICGRTHSAHRVAYETLVGPIPPGMIVRHTCDNPPCVRPEHLKLGTKADNTRDMIERGRSKLHLSGPRSRKLNDSQVSELRRLVANGELSQRKAAKRYGISQPAVHGIVTYRNYRI